MIYLLIAYRNMLSPDTYVCCEKTTCKKKQFIYASVLNTVIGTWVKLLPDTDKWTNFNSHNGIPISKMDETHRGIKEEFICSKKKKREIVIPQLGSWGLGVNTPGAGANIS